MLNRLEMMRIFCAAAEATSFKEASAKLGISPQSVTRAIKALENKVGEPLFYRNTRQIHITDFGEQLAQRARESIANIDDIFMRSNKIDAADMAGVIRIAAPTTFGRRFLPPILSSIAINYPNISFELKLSDAIADVVEQQIDIGIRVGFLRDSSFVARATSKMYFYTVAAPSLIKRVGAPQTITELLELPSIALINASSGKSWPWYFDDGQQYKHKHVSFLTDDPETELNMVLSGNGFGQIADCLAAPHLQSGKLVRVLIQHTPPPWDIYVYRPQRGPVPARIRMLYDEIANAFSNMQTLKSA